MTRCPAPVADSLAPDFLGLAVVCDVDLHRGVLRSSGLTDSSVTLPCGGPWVSDPSPMGENRHKMKAMKAMKARQRRGNHFGDIQCSSDTGMGGVCAGPWGLPPARQAVYIEENSFACLRKETGVRASCLNFIASLRDEDDALNRSKLQQILSNLFLRL